ncbi:MAG: hypothetical protein A2X82_15875 [Geobacteraceae bacterium GWC2_55_20]|nr:MAG: hypothetical protein A2X82_15875 [Geobacteraceae bacterium GWC2_55_20]HBA72285.1 DUF4149 domain-containing protein [Geobacter sp.]HCE66713.1 DUF4149 domain-containing protein [Geobacter sp.]
MKYAETIYRLAIALWVGGGALFTFVLTPLLFKTESRDTAGRIVGTFFPGYFRWGLACGAIALVSRLLQRGGRLELAGVILVLMLAVTSFQAFYVEPKAADIKSRIVSFETTPKSDPLRQQFSKLHGVSAVCNLAVVAGGVVLVILL